MALEIATDCKHYIGDRPCAFKERCTCDHYEPMGTRILIIKLGALGDVVRTACLLPTLKREYPESHITWVSRPNGVRILKGHPQIDRLVGFDAEGILTLREQPFDLVLSLDKEPGPTALCNAVEAPDKRGIRMSPYGTPEPCEARCEPYFELGLDDDLKFHHNRKTYPQLIHEAVGLAYAGEPYRLPCDEDALARAVQMAQAWRDGSQAPLIGLNTGAGSVFANKAPSPERWVEIASRLLADEHAVILLGGPEEEDMNAWIMKQTGSGVHTAGCRNSEQQFTAIVSQCDALITGDTLGLHIALARNVPVVALFGPTCEQEIDLFNLGTKIVSPCDCGPCYRRECDKQPNCMDMISTEEIVSTAKSVVAKAFRSGGTP